MILTVGVCNTDGGKSCSGRWLLMMRGEGSSSMAAMPGHGNSMNGTRSSRFFCSADLMAPNKWKEVNLCEMEVSRDEQ